MAAKKKVAVKKAPAKKAPAKAPVKAPAKKVPASQQTVDAGPSTKSALVTMPPAMVQSYTQAVDIASHALALKVKDATSLEVATTLLGTLKARQQNTKALWEQLWGPIKRHIKAMDAQHYKPVLERLEQADTALRQKVLAYREEQRAEAEAQRVAAEEKAAEAEQRAQEAQEGGDSEAAQVAMEEAQEHALEAVSAMGPARTVDSGGQVATRRVWKYEVTDLSLVPREYLTLDAGRVRAAVNSGAREVPGLRIWQEEQLSVSSSLPELQ